MTTLRHPQGRAAGSQVLGRAPASDPGSCAWNVNLNNGNSNINNQNNSGLALAVRGPVAFPGECQGEVVTFRQLYEAFTSARRQKCSHNQMQFEAHALDNLLQLQRRLNAGTWSPAPSICFIATRPKAREIHAPDFGDRVVHHLLVPTLERIWEPRFIHHSYANRQGKGTHAAVRQLGAFVRQVDSGQGRGWFLQLDISNCFNRINRRILWDMVKRGLAGADVPEVITRAVHALLRNAPLAAGVQLRASAQELAFVPPHKRLANAPSNCGLPIGNLSSQFLVNVYLDALDQFVKRTLRAPRYLRYVDDFVLVHQHREQLEIWLDQIRQFLADTLQLELKADIRLRPLQSGIDFLGYVVRPTHNLVRRRVVSHAREALNAWQQKHVAGDRIRATPAQIKAAVCVWSSYQGHFTHASSARLQQDFHQRFPWLHAVMQPRRFHHRLEHTAIEIPIYAGGQQRSIT